MDISQNRPSAVRWRSVALPTEHGGWAFVIEPLLLGFILAPAVSGFTFAIAALSAFLLRQPLKLYLKDVRNHRSVPRTRIARQFVMLYGAVMLLAALVTLLHLPSLNALIPLLMALPLFALQLRYDLRSQSRSAAAEIAGALATGAFAACMVLMQDWSLPAALGLWLVLAAKAVTAILYVRARLRLERERSSGLMLPILAHATAVMLLSILTLAHLTTWASPIGMTLLTARAALGLSAWRKPRPPKVIGMQEVAYGLLFVLIVAAGYRLG